MLHTFDTSSVNNQISPRQAYQEFRTFRAAWKVAFVTLLVVTFLPLLILMLIGSSVNDIGAIIFLVMLALFGLGALYNLYREINELAVARRFANENNLDFFRDGYRSEYAGGPFRAKYYISYLMSTRESLPLELGHLRPIFSQRRSSGSLTYTYIRLKLPIQLPHIVLQLKTEKSIIKWNMEGSARLQLEGQFGDMFNLYTPKGQERDALYIFTPDVMARFIDAVGAFDCEIIGDELYFYSYQNIPFIRTYNLQKIVAALNYVMPKFERQSGKFSAANTRFSVANKGVPAPTRMGLGVGKDFYITAAAFGILLIIGIIISITG